MRCYPLCANSLPLAETKQEASMAASSHSNHAAWPQILARWNIEITSLYAKRAQEWLAIPFSLSRCSSPADLAAAQLEFSETLVADYRRAAERITQAVGANGDAYAESILKAQDDAREIIEQAKAQAKLIIEDAERRSEMPAVRAA
jgi:hypothetical protein